MTRQLEDCEALATKLGVSVVGRFDDNDISAFSGKTRPDFENMLAVLKRGEADMIICWHADRLYRSMKDLERLIDVVDRGIEIRTVTAGILTCRHRRVGCLLGFLAVWLGRRVSGRLNAGVGRICSAPKRGSGVRIRRVCSVTPVTVNCWSLKPARSGKPCVMC